MTTLATSIPVNALAEPHTCQFSPAFLWARLVPSPWRLLLAAVSRYPALAAALPHRGRSLAFLGKPSLPFGALTGGSLFSRPKERCPRRFTPSSCRPSCSFSLGHIFVSSGRVVSSGDMRRHQPWTPWPSTSRVSLSGGCLHHTDPLVCFHALRICRRLWWPLLSAIGNRSFYLNFCSSALVLARRSLGDELTDHSVLNLL